MPTIRKILSGRQAKNHGTAFENILKGSAEMRGWYVTRHPSGCKRVWTPGGILTKDVPTEYDFTFVKSGAAIFVDAKTISTGAYAYSMITRHQVDALYEYEKHGMIAGYIINYAEMNKTSFFKASRLKAMRPRESIKPEDGLIIGNNLFIDIDLLKDKGQR